MEVEDAFGLRISDSEAEETSGSVDSIVRLIARKLDDQAKPPATFARIPRNVDLPLSPVKRTASSA